MDETQSEIRDEYLELLKLTLTHSLWQERYRIIDPKRLPHSFKRLIAKLLVESTSVRNS